MQALAGLPTNAQKIHLDTGETVYISGMALLKMLKHGRQGIPIEVIGLMLGSFVDDYTISVVDVFATPQSATGTSVEAIEDAFQAEMVELLKNVGRPENVVGWYHSHPGYGVFLSDVDVQQQRSFERLNTRCIAVVVDPVRSVRGKVVIAAFRSTPLQDLMMNNKEPRETTAFTHASYVATSHFHKPDDVYYQLNISYRMSAPEEHMLKSLNRPEWSRGFSTNSFAKEDSNNLSKLKALIDSIPSYKQDITDEEKLSGTDYQLRHVGKVDPKEFLRSNSEALASHVSSQLFRTNLNATTFK
ncbi:Clan MP, family M67, Poh1-like metallopeptidase [Trichomonas vaginalis G3]|uniref:Clan MP, family M67, Poh1-like metallopeptidase n=1 Tax=Trichomonas vaginalis (strain ATCC PRA-98 / G3) TaxID=412133 RepID=A2F5B3_TRIV3|nr:metallopeptidase protein [Trichomonas vaginalis G3]EAX99938.1 Clan MP, family M67, Poh1-like metallopeptidase [Trichomonas vaginalis G3]KAI5547781.1 metallopeptidase protein [Trichomonas vaginalis G3]|eukprot:XP_001312868.1 Clan MP, family M67, Poh1-like metallopeptidase [Trichomonas vaginalis G3]